MTSQSTGLATQLCHLKQRPDSDIHQPTASGGTPNTSFAKHCHTIPGRRALVIHAPASGGGQAFSEDLHRLLMNAILHAVNDNRPLAMICHTKRKTFSTPQPDEQPPGDARHKHFKSNDTRNAALRSPSPVTHRQAENGGPPALRVRPDPDTGSGQVAGPIVCGAPPPFPSSAVSNEISAENVDRTEMTLDGASQLETNGGSFYIFPPGRQHDFLMTDVDYEVASPVTLGPASHEYVRPLLTPPAEKSPREQLRATFRRGASEQV